MRFFYITELKTKLKCHDTTSGIKDLMKVETLEAIPSFRSNFLNTV